VLHELAHGVGTIDALLDDNDRIRRRNQAAKGKRDVWRETPIAMTKRQRILSPELTEAYFGPQRFPAPRPGSA